MLCISLVFSGQNIYHIIDVDHERVRLSCPVGLRIVYSITYEIFVQ